MSLENSNPVQPKQVIAIFHFEEGWQRRQILATADWSEVAANHPKLLMITDSATGKTLWSKRQVSTAAAKPNRIFFDTEFIEDGHTIDLISIGLASADGRVLYLENGECDLSRASEWVRENVLPHLRGGSCRKSRAEMRQMILEFAGERPEFWAYYADYDWVVLCQLFGRMIDLPKGWPMHCRDLKQELDRFDVTVPKQASVAHHALADAVWCRDSLDLLVRSGFDVIRPRS